MSIKQFNAYMLNGRHEFRLYPQHEDGEFTGYQVSFIDAECDPITVNIDATGLRPRHHTREIETMKLEITNRFTGAVQFTAEIECADGAPESIKVGLAVKWALQNSANLRGAYLSGANLSDADLSGANLRGAYLSGADLRRANGIIRVGPSTDGYEFFGVIREGAVWVKAGCRWLTADDARAHWGKTRGGTDLGAERIAFVDFIAATMNARNPVEVQS